MFSVEYEPRAKTRLIQTTFKRGRRLAVSEITVIATVNLLLMCGEKRTVCVVKNAKGHILDTRIVGVFSLHIVRNVESTKSQKECSGILRCADIL